MAPSRRKRLWRAPLSAGAPAVHSARRGSGARCRPAGSAGAGRARGRGPTVSAPRGRPRVRVPLGRTCEGGGGGGRPPATGSNPLLRSIYFRRPGGRVAPTKHASRGIAGARRGRARTWALLGRRRRATRVPGRAPGGRRWAGPPRRHSGGQGAWRGPLPGRARAGVGLPVEFCTAGPAP